MAATTRKADDVNPESDQKNAMGRMVVHEQKQARMRLEENERIIEQMMADGNMTEEEAQVRMTRMKMHQQGEDQDAMGGNEIKGIVAAGVDFKTTEQILEDMLDTRASFSLMGCIKDLLGISKIDRIIQKERERRNNKRYKHSCPFLRDTVRSSSFELSFGVLMILNSLTIGMQASMSDEERLMSGMAELMEAFENAFTGFFVLEIFLRVLVEGWVWMCALSNMADTSLILFTGVLPMWILKPAGIQSGSAVRAVQVLRVLRLVRVARMVRTVKQFRTLWKLIRGISDSAKTLLWTYVLMGSVLYVLGIFAVYWLGKSPGLKDDPYAQQHFGDVPSAVFTLFQTATLDGWSTIARTLLKTAPDSSLEIYFVFASTIVIVAIVLLNLITAVILQTAVQRSNQDQELAARETREKNDAEIKDLQDVFVEIDADGSGMLSKEEYMDALARNQRVKAKMEFLQIGAEEQEEIWELLDDGSGEVSVERFADCLRAMQGDAMAKDSFTLVKHVQRVNRQLEGIDKRLTDQQELVDTAKQECAAAHRQLGFALQEVLEFVAYASCCVPSSPAPMTKKELERCRARLEAKADEIRKREEERRINELRELEQSGLRPSTMAK